MEETQKSRVSPEWGDELDEPVMVYALALSTKGRQEVLGWFRDAEKAHQAGTATGKEYLVIPSAL